MPTMEAPRRMFRTRPRSQQLPRCYADAAQMLGNRESRVIANNTRLLWTPRDGSLSVRLHETRIITWYAPSSPWNEQLLNVDTGGFYTDTTFNRISRCLPVGWRMSGRTVSRRTADNMLPPTWTITDPAGNNWTVYDNGTTFDLNSRTHRAA